jgi:hypothetical protein
MNDDLITNDNTTSSQLTITNDDVSIPNEPTTTSDFQFHAALPGTQQGKFQKQQQPYQSLEDTSRLSRGDVESIPTMLDVVTKRFEKRKTQNQHGHMSNRYACLATDDDDCNEE